MTTASSTNGAAAHHQAPRKYRLSRDEQLRSALEYGNPWRPSEVIAYARQATIEALDPALAAQLRSEAEGRA